MSKQKKGFDPLSSLFDTPPLDAEFLFEDDELEDEEMDAIGQRIDMTDPVFSPPPDMGASTSEEIFLNVHTEEHDIAALEIPPEEQDRIARELALPTTQDSAAQDEAPQDDAVQDDAAEMEPEVSPEEQAQIARDLAMKAVKQAASPLKRPPRPSLAEQASSMVSPEEQARIARELAMKAMQQAPALPEEGAVSAEEQARIARELAMKAMQQSAAPPSRPPPPPQLSLSERTRRPLSALEAARQAAAREEAARAAAAEVTAELPAEISASASGEVSAEEQARIARELAMKAMQQAPALPEDDAVSVDEQVRIARELAQRALTAATEPEEEPETPKTLSDRAQRPMTALEAARAAVQEEAKQSERRRRRRVSKLTARIRRLVPASLPELGKHKVANAIVTDERQVLVTLWRAHRTKFLHDGHIERAVSAATVLHALENCPEGMLLAAHVVTEVSDYLVWIDMSDESLIAAFPDARAWFAS